ncbi:MAG: alpha/beta hydrolase [Nocardioides sp.]
MTDAVPAPTRRGLLTGALALAVPAAVTGCSVGPTVPTASVGTSTYGSDPSQVGELYIPGRIPLATVVVIHGGYWAEGFGAFAMRPMCQALQAEGYAVWNLEYRRVGGTGGWPMTFADVAAGIDHLNTFDTVDAGDVRLVGHSAGGQLAVWAASRRDTTPGGPSGVTVTRCVSLAGVLDLTSASQEGLGSGNVDLLMGGSPEVAAEHYAEGDPTLLVPAGCQVACLVGHDDEVVPRTQSDAYVAAAEAVGAPVTLDEVPGDHSALIDPKSDAWPTVLQRLGEKLP